MLLLLCEFIHFWVMNSHWVTNSQNSLTTEFTLSSGFGWPQCVLPLFSSSQHLPATLSSVSLFPSSEYRVKSNESRVLMLPARSAKREKSVTLASLSRSLSHHLLLPFVYVFPSHLHSQPDTTNWRQLATNFWTNNFLFNPNVVRQTRYVGCFVFAPLVFQGRSKNDS